MRGTTFLLIALALAACDESGTEKATATSKLLGERLIAEHGEGVLQQPVLIVYDSGFVVGRGSVDQAFGSNVSKLGLRPASSLSAGQSPVPTSEFYSQEGVELGVSIADKVVVADSTSSLTLRLAFGPAGLNALRSCEKIKLDRVCKVDDELRARLDDIEASGASLIEDGQVVGRAKMQRGWAVFSGVPEIGDEVQLELIVSAGVHCNLSKWLVDPRDSCAM